MTKKGTTHPGVPDEMKRCVRENRIGLEFSERRMEPADLQPEHLPALFDASKLCLQAVGNSRDEAAKDTGEETRWWIQFSLLDGMNNAIRAMDMLSAGLGIEILDCYATPSEISGAGLTRNNAHELAAQIALELVSRAWSVIRIADGDCKKPYGIESLLTFRRPLVRMSDDDDGASPVFRQELVADVAQAILALPEYDADTILSRMRWERRAVESKREPEWSAWGTRRWICANVLNGISTKSLKRRIDSGLIQYQQRIDGKIRVRLDGT